MIENIRKYKFVIVFALVLVGAALVVGLQSDIIRKQGGHHTLFRISGRSYDDVDYQRLGDGGYNLASALGDLRQGGDFEFFQLLMGLAAGAQNANEAPQKFFIGRMVLRDAKEEFGIYPSDEEITAHIHKMRYFFGPDQNFSEEKFRSFTEKGIGRLGLGEGDVRDLVSDLLAYKKINAIVGSGLAVNREIATRQLALENQEVSGSLARLDVAPFEAKIEPTEEEVKAYWENIKDQFSTSPLRKFSYVLVTPDLPKEDADKKDDKPNSIVEAAATDESKKKAEAEKAKKAAELAETRRKKQLETDQLMDEFSVALEDAQGKGFDELAKKNNWEIKTTDLFAQNAAPKELDINLRSSSRGGKAVEEIFKIEPTSDPLSSFSQPIPVGDGQWLIARLDAKEDSRTKTYEEARVEARSQYIHEKAAENMKKAATEALEKIKTAVAAGKSFADAAKEAGVTETKDFSKVGSTYRADPATEPSNLFDATRNVDPGTFAELVSQPERNFIVFVAKREVVKEENATARIEAKMKSETSQNEMFAFTGWMAARIEAAKVEELFKK